MNPLSPNARATATKSWPRAVGFPLGLAILSLVLADCNGQAPKGQVVAVVNGQEVTGQDLASEGRAAGAQASQNPQAVLQRVIARVLLAQSAHTQKLDQYPGYPSDAARLQQDFLAQKALTASVKPAVKPTQPEIDRFVAEHPFMFKDRVRFQADELRFQSADDMKSLNGTTTITDVISRLKSLSIPFDRGTRTIDSAEIPAPLTQKLLSLPENQVLFIRDHTLVLAVAVTGRQATVVPPPVQTAMATQIMSHLSTQGQVDAQVNALRKAAKIVYQPGYAPASPPNAKSAAAPAPGATPKP